MREQDENGVATGQRYVELLQEAMQFNETLTHLKYCSGAS